MEYNEYEVTGGEEKTLRLFFGGDTLIGKSAKQIIEKEGYEYTIIKLGDFYKQADVKIINLETPICEKAKKIDLEKQYKYKTSPKVIELFEKYNFNIFLLANNHTTDCGMDGLRETISLLHERRMKTIGAGMNLDEARRGIMIKKGNLKVGLLNYMNYKSYYDQTLHHYANHEHGGVNGVSKLIYEDIDSLRRNGASRIIVSIHWGKNYKPVNREQKQLAKFIIDAGADLIIGHGSHQYQPIGMVGNKLVFYSIGNFIFHTTGKSPLTYGFPLIITMNEAGIYKIEIYSIAVNNRIVHYQPVHLTGYEGQYALDELYKQSDLANITKIKLSTHGILYL